MAFGMSTQNIAPTQVEKTQPSKSSMKLAYKGKKKKSVPESKESPAMEAQNHGASFLKKAAMMKGKC